MLMTIHGLESRYSAEDHYSHGTVAAISGTLSFGSMTEHSEKVLKTPCKPD